MSGSPPTASGFKDTFGSYVPKWLSNRPGRNAGFRFLWSMIVGLDMLLETARQGVLAAWPGKGTPTADPLIGQSRGLLQGENETAAHFEERCIRWLTTWENAGSDEELANEIQQYIGNTPEVRIVTRAGNWTILSSSGVFSYVTGVPLNWDSQTYPAYSSRWSDIWIIISPCEWPVTGPTLASLVGVWGTYQGVGTGHACGRAAVDAILSLVQLWKGAHCYVRAIVWTYDPTKMNPAYPASLPDGNWGKWGKNGATFLGLTTYVASRDPALRFWEPANG